MPVLKQNGQLQRINRRFAITSVDSDSILSASVAIQWGGFDCQFTDWRYFPVLNLRCDHLPTEIQSQFTGKTCGDLIKHTFEAGELIPDRRTDLLQNIAGNCFQPPNQNRTTIAPLIGRFYPQDDFHNVAGIYQGNKFPCRVTAVSKDRLSLDLNHPLAGKKITMMLRIESIKNSPVERGGRCNDIVAELCDMGPGMQDRLAEHETDFLSDNPFERIDNNDDTEYFQRPRLTPYWDALALQQVSEFYARHVAPRSNILDLMAGVHSPLQEANINAVSVTAAGLNQQELDANKICSRTIVLDVNNITHLPFEDAEFDVVLIHAAIEYVIHPQVILNEISRILKPAGKIIISFTNRGESQKSIRIWSEIENFERPGLVLSYLRSQGNFGHFESFSKRGLLRPDNDQLSSELIFSDPVYIVQGEKIEPQT